MKLKKALSALAASVLMAVSGVSAVSANAATTTAAANASSIIAGVDSRLSFLGSMPMKGDINGDKKITSEDTAVLEAYINKLVTITPYSRAFNILDINWDGKLDKNDLSRMPKGNTQFTQYSSFSSFVVAGVTTPYPLLTFHTGDFNSDGVVNSKDLNMLNSMIKNIESASKYKLAIYDPHGFTDLFFISRQYDVNGDYAVNSKDYDALKKYISFFPGIGIVVGLV